MADLSIRTLRGGLNTTDPPHLLRDDQVRVAENVEWAESTLGERRQGCDGVDLPAALTAEDMVFFLHRHFPTDDETSTELWAGAWTPGVSATFSRKTTSWSTITFNDAIIVDDPEKVNAVSLHGKLYIAYLSLQDRLHVADISSTTVRRAGLKQPAAPTVAEQGVGTFSGTRFYRVRYTVQSSGVTIRRSEPSTSTEYDPADFGSNGASARVTKPAAISENETHWELEASLDNVNFYRIATTAVGTTTFDDSTAFSVGYATSGNVLSEDIGDYRVIPSGRFLTTDNDRLIIGGHQTDASQMSKIRWTVVGSDPTGVGNDERWPLDTNNELDLNGVEGGRLTGLSQSYGNGFFAFKFGAIYRLSRTNQRSRAYVSKTVTKRAGALHGSIVSAPSATGEDCIYFLDPKTGPMRIGPKGLEACGYDILRTWRDRVTLTGVSAGQVASKVVYYPDKKQIHWFVPMDGATVPTHRLVLHIDYTFDAPEGVRGGWAIHSGKSCEAHCAILYATNVNSGTARSLTLKPIIGLNGITVAEVQMLDIGDTDDGEAYTGRIVSKAYSPMGLQQKFGINAATLLATPASAVTVAVTAILDYGKHEPSTASALLTPAGSEEFVIVDMDNLIGAEARAISFKFQDVTAARWELQQLDIGPKDEERMD